MDIIENFETILVNWGRRGAGAAVGEIVVGMIPIRGNDIFDIFILICFA